jgi:tRNA U54 and U55 pseudouridine synthase Pus10
MLKGGRPFVLEFVNPILRLKHLSFEEILKKSKLDEENKISILQKFKLFS